VENFNNKKPFPAVVSAGAGVGFSVENPSICVASEQRKETTRMPHSSVCGFYKLKNGAERLM
jgi:hypothetical protein